LSLLQFEVVIGLSVVLDLPLNEILLNLPVISDGLQLLLLIADFFFYSPLLVDVVFVPLDLLKRLAVIIGYEKSCLCCPLPVFDLSEK